MFSFKIVEVRFVDQEHHFFANMTRSLFQSKQHNRASLVLWYILA